MHDTEQTNPFEFDLDNWIGSTRFLPESEWPDNFVPDPDWENKGTWYCPMCKEGLAEHKARCPQTNSTN